MSESLEVFRKTLGFTGREKGDYYCPECGEKTILSSGFSGKPFCWGKCYHYFPWDSIKKE